MNSLLNCTAEKFFEEEENFNHLHGIVSREYKITLKLLEYSAFNLGYILEDVSLQGAYSDRLSAYGKREFDSFRRHRSREITRFGKTLVTNISQMRFVKFAITSGLIKFLIDEKNKDRVIKMMAAKTRTESIGFFDQKYIFF